MSATTPQHNQSPYLKSRITDRHITRYGIIQVPSSGPDSTNPPCALIKVHAAYQYRVVDFYIVESGSQPIAPAAFAQPGEVLKYENTIIEQSRLICAAYGPPSGSTPGVVAGGITSMASASQVGGGANAAAGAPSPPEPAVSPTPGGQTITEQDYIFEKRGRLVFLKSGTPVPQTQLSYPQGPYDVHEPIAVNPATWVSTLLGDDGGSEASSSPGTSGSGSTPGGGP
jgi:hypothetical protein